MSDKSPRSTMSKKPGKSLKEKRAAKRAANSPQEALSPVTKTTKRG